MLINSNKSNAEVKTEEKKKIKKTLIGGQAVLEGVMMRGATSMATAVRDQDGVIRVETKRLKPPKERSIWTKIPFIRGSVNLVDSLVSGSKTLMRSAEVFGESEPTKFEKWCEKKLHFNLMSFITVFSVILGVALAVGLFIFAPIYLTKWLQLATGALHPIAVDFIEGGIKILIFICYLLLVSCLKDIRRTFKYHGAEHKTISCYEKGLELTPENAKKCSRVHNRCGTTFIFFVLFISILVFASVEAIFIACNINFNEIHLGRLYKALIKLALLPLVAGISYELLKALAKTDNPIFLPIKAPGLLLQRITTREPDEEMLEVAITAFKTVLEMDADPTIPERNFVTAKKLPAVVQSVKDRLAKGGIEEGAEAEWIVSLTTGYKRDELRKDVLITPKYVAEIDRLVEERLTGRPLWYCIGDTEFYGYKIKVDERALIPRAETEEVLGEALKYLDENKSLLDLCTGSGCMAVAAAKKKNCKVTAADISEDAVNLAKENAMLGGVEIEFVTGDLFENLEGRVFDVIVTNPPYIAESERENVQKEVINFEPHIALFSGEDGLDLYRRIAENSGKHLVSGGVLVGEIGDTQGEEVKRLFEKNGFTVEILKDLNGLDRIVKAVKNVF